MRQRPRPHRKRTNRVAVASSPSDDIFRRLQQAFLEKNELYDNKDALKRSVDNYPPVLLKEYREDKDKYILFAMLKHDVNVVEYIKNGRVDSKRVMELRSGDNETIFDYAINDFNKDIFNLVFEVDCRQACMDALMHRSDDHDSVLETMINELEDFDYEYFFGNDNTNVGENVDAMKNFLLKENSYVIRTLHEQNDDLLSTIQESLKKTMVNAVDSQRSIRSDARDYIDVDDDASEDEIEYKIDGLTHDHAGHSHAQDVENACKDIIDAIDQVRSKTTALVEKYKEEFPNGTPLVIACEKGRLDDVEILIRAARAAEKNVREIVNARGNGSNGYTSYTPLIAAVQFEHSSVVSYLLTLPEVDTAITNNRWNALHYAANSNKTTDIVNKLLNKMKLEDINYKGAHGNTPLDRCFFNHSPHRQAIINLMRSKGALTSQEVDLIKKYKNDFPHKNPLVVACEKGLLNDVKTFVNAEMKVNQISKDSHGWESTPLMIAAWNEHFQVVKYLIEQGEADPNIARSNGANALHLAAKYNKKDTELIELLLTNMSLDSINKKTSGGYTPLDYADENYNPMKQAIIDLMQSKGAKRASELSGSSTVEEEVVHEGTKTVDEQLAEQLKKAEEKGDVIDLTDAHESVNDQLHKHATPSDQSELNKTLKKIKQLEDERKKINNELKKLRRRASRANGYPKDGSTNKRQRIKLLDAIGELKF